MFLITIECAWNCLSCWNQHEQQSEGLPFQTREVQQGIPRNLGTNPYMSPYVETVSWEFFLAKILQKSSQGPTKVLFFSWKQVSGRNGDHDDLDWPMLSYYVIYYEKFRKVLQRTEKVALTVKHLNIGHPGEGPTPE